MTQEYAINKFSLNVKGATTIHQLAGLFRFIRATGAGGVLSLNAEVEVALGTATDDFIPLSPGQAILAMSRKWKVRWNAQPGVTATIFLSADKDAADVDAHPADQLITVAMATTPTQTVITVGVAPVALLGANLTRKAVTFLNKGAAAIYIGKADVLVTDGLEIVPGQSYTSTSCTGAYFAISGAASQDVRVLEEHS